MKGHLLLPDQASRLCDGPATPAAMSHRQTGDGCAHRGRLACPGSKGYPDLPDQPPCPGSQTSLPQLASPWPEGSFWNRGVTPYSGPSHLPAPGLAARPPSGPCMGFPVASPPISLSPAAFLPPSQWSQLLPASCLALYAPLGVSLGDSGATHTSSCPDRWHLLWCGSCSAQSKHLVRA